MLATAKTDAGARGRSVYGGRVQLRLPWPVTAIDPHRLDDAAAAIFGSALFDTLYAFTDAGERPSLAEAPPQTDGREVKVRLREGLTTASGRPLRASDVIASIARARAGDAHAWLTYVPVPRRLDDLTLSFAAAGPAALMRALASPLVAIIPTGFRPDAPDGTGPLMAVIQGDSVALRRNPNAARGPAILDEIVAFSSPNLAASLRAFESGVDDIGWLGSGLHETRAGSVPFDSGSVAWAVLRTGARAGLWDSPGTSQSLCDGIAPASLSHLSVGSPWAPESNQGWGGSPADLLVRADCPWLVELATAVAATLSRPGREVTPRPCAASVFAEQRAARTFALAIDLVRPFLPDAAGALASLASASDQVLALDVLRHPPRLREGSVRTLTRGLHIGVLGEIRARGGLKGDLLLPGLTEGGPDWAGACRRTSRS